MLPPARIVQVPPLQVPALQISKSDDPDPVTPGSFLQYTLVYTNAGDVVAQAVVITETYPASTTYFAALPAPTSGDNVWSMGDLAPGATGTIVVTVTVANELPMGTVLVNTVSIEGSNAAPANFIETTQVDSASNVTISKVDSADPVRVDDVFTYTIEYRNDGMRPPPVSASPKRIPAR